MTKLNGGQQFNELLDNWREELILRNQVRDDPENYAFVFSSEKDIWLNYRSLFFTDNKPLFFQGLFNNLHLMPAINWLAIAPYEVIRDFLEFLPWYIAKNQPQPEKLSFLINIYNHNLYSYYWRIINMLELPCCQFLLPRTANKELKGLLQTRQKQLIKARKERYFGLCEESASRSGINNTIHGNRLEKLKETIESISTHSHFSTDPYSAERFYRLLQSSDLIFECGMVEDCVAVLIYTYQNYEKKNRIAKILDDEQIFKQFHKLLRKAIPFYTLITKPTRTYSLAEELFNNYFPHLTPEPGSLLYLKLFEGILHGFSANSKNIILELLVIASQILQYRPNELPLLVDTVILEGLDSKYAAELIQIGKERIPSMPHEGFIILELIRLLLFYNLTKMEKAEISSLLEGYLRLFHWMPSHLFINHSIVKQLAPLVVNPLRQEIEDILKTIDYYHHPDKLENDLRNRAHLFSGKKGSLRAEVLIGKYLGGL